MVLGVARYVCVCIQGDTIDDLCRPEFEDELTELKELGEVHVHAHKS